MELADLLDIRPGVTAVVGSGGKTALLRTLGTALAAKGQRVALCATAKFYPFPGLPCLLSPTLPELMAALDRERLVCVGKLLPDSGKLAAPELSMAELASAADYVLAEADGSAGLPLKAHAEWEPVIPPEAARVVCVVGASGLGRPIAEAAHRPERFAALAGTTPEDAASPENVARVLAAEALADIYFFNQSDTGGGEALALQTAALLGRPAALGALRKGVWRKCSL